MPSFLSRLADKRLTFSYKGQPVKVALSSVLAAVGMLFLITGGVAASYLVQQRQNITPSACNWECNSCGCGCSDYFDSRPECRAPATGGGSTAPAAPNCASGWSCNGKCADQTAVNLFNGTWQDGKARWLWEAAGNSASCGGNPSAARTATTPAGQGGGTVATNPGTTAANRQTCSPAAPTASACTGVAVGSDCRGYRAGYAKCLRTQDATNGYSDCGCVINTNAQGQTNDSCTQDSNCASGYCHPTQKTCQARSSSGGTTGSTGSTSTTGVGGSAVGLGTGTSGTSSTTQTNLVCCLNPANGIYSSANGSCGSGLSQAHTGACTANDKSMVCCRNTTNSTYQSVAGSCSSGTVQAHTGSCSAAELAGPVAARSTVCADYHNNATGCNAIATCAYSTVQGRCLAKSLDGQACPSGSTRITSSGADFNKCRCTNTGVVIEVNGSCPATNKRTGESCTTNAECVNGLACLGTTGSKTCRTLTTQCYELKQDASSRWLCGTTTVEGTTCPVGLYGLGALSSCTTAANTRNAVFANNQAVTGATTTGPNLATGACVDFNRLTTLAQGLKRLSCADKGGFDSTTCECKYPAVQCYQLTQDSRSRWQCTTTSALGTTCPAGLFAMSDVASCNSAATTRNAVFSNSSEPLVATPRSTTPPTTVNTAAANLAACTTGCEQNIPRGTANYDQTLARCKQGCLGVAVGVVTQTTSPQNLVCEQSQIADCAERNQPQCTRTGIRLNEYTCATNDNNVPYCSNTTRIRCALNGGCLASPNGGSCRGNQIPCYRVTGSGTGSGYVCQTAGNLGALECNGRPLHYTDQGSCQSKAAQLNAEDAQSTATSCYAACNARMGTEPTLASACRQNCDNGATAEDISPTTPALVPTTTPTTPAVSTSCSATTRAIRQVSCLTQGGFDEATCNCRHYAPPTTTTLPAPAVSTQPAANSCNALLKWYRENVACRLQGGFNPATCDCRLANTDSTSNPLNNDSTNNLQQLNQVDCAALTSTQACELNGARCQVVNGRCTVK